MKEERRTHRLIVHLTSEERERLRELARAEGEAEAVFVRGILRTHIRGEGQATRARAT